MLLSYVAVILGITSVRMLSSGVRASLASETLNCGVTSGCSVARLTAQAGVSVFSADTAFQAYCTNESGLSTCSQIDLNHCVTNVDGNLEPLNKYVHLQEQSKPCFLYQKTQLVETDLAIRATTATW
jgi:CVNH domain